MKQSILWRGNYMPGHEYCTLLERGPSRFLEGVAAFVYEDQPCRIDYLVECDSDWNTKRARVFGSVGMRSINIELRVEPYHSWVLSGTPQQQVTGCTDIDLNFSPSTNLIPVRRLKLEVGQQAEVNAAWLRFPSFKLERLDQIYRRLDQTTYRYESNGGKFVAEIKVNDFGLVISYPGLWEEEKGAGTT